MTKDEAKEKSGFALNPVGYTGTFFVPKHLSIGGFVNCRILEVRGDKFFVELEDGSKGEIPRKEFTPMLITERKEA
jgi:hypothetical protein